MEGLYSQIRSNLKKEPEILAAYVIGSAASGSLTGKSDFDLVVVRNSKGLDLSRVYELVRHLAFPKDLDLSVVDRASSPIFLYQIISKGRRIYQQGVKQVQQFETYVLHNYYDTAHLRNIYHQGLKRELSKYAN